MFAVGGPNRQVLPCYVCLLLVFAAGVHNRQVYVLCVPAAGG